MIRSTLQAHQVRGVRFLITKKYAVLGFKTGKGKTLTSLAALHHFVDGKRTYGVVVAPKKAYDRTWSQEIEKHTDMKWIKFDDLVERLMSEGSWEFILDYDVVLVKYPHVQESKYSRILEILFQGRIIIGDESHRMKGQNTKLTRAMSFYTNKSMAKWGLTATSITNNIMDLYGLTEFFSPGFFGSEWGFKKRYCILKDKVIGRKPSRNVKQADGTLRKVGGDLITRKEIAGYKNLDELKARIETFMLIEESDMKVNFHEIRYEVTDAEDDVYLKAAAGVLEREEDDKKGFAQRLGDIQRAVDGSRDINGVPQTTYRSSKYMVYKAEIEKCLYRGESVIVFADLLDTKDMLLALFQEDMAVPVYTADSKEAIEDWKQPCIVVLTAGGSESLNLGFANHVLVYSIAFSVLAVIQCIGRITRMGSKHLDNLHAYLPVCEETIDLYKYRYLMSNIELINKVLGKEANLPDAELRKTRKDMLGELRKELLWRTKKRKK